MTLRCRDGTIRESGLVRILSVRYDTGADRSEERGFALILCCTARRRRMMLIARQWRFDRRRGYDPGCSSLPANGKRVAASDRGDMRRVWLRGRYNVQKSYLIHVAGYSLGLPTRLLTGAASRSCFRRV